MTADLGTRVALVTGGGGGIGSACAAALHDAGARVAVADAAIAAAEATANLLGSRAVAIELDVADADAVRAAFDRVAADLGGVDIVVNAAGIASRGTLASLPPSEWHSVLSVNLSGAFHCIQSACPHLIARGGGSIVNVASIAARWIAFNSGAHYSASKAGLLALTRQAAFELGRHNIRVNAVLPGPMTNRMGGGTTRHADAVLPDLPLGRAARPSDVAAAVMFLCGPGASMITGAELAVDGGFLTGTTADLRSYFASKSTPFERTALPW